MAEQILDLPARHGIPHIIGGLTGDLDNPAYATAIGTLVYGFHKQVDHKGLHSLKESATKRSNFWGSLINRFR
jgi:cell division ATPase FtsA